MDKSVAQSTISKSKPVSSSSESEDDCDKNAKKTPETIKSVHFYPSLIMNFYRQINNANDHIRILLISLNNYYLTRNIYKPI